MTQRTAKFPGSVFERHRILHSEILWINVDGEDGEQDDVWLLRSSPSLRPQHAEAAEVIVSLCFASFICTDQVLSSADSER